jgi:uncharacterized protein
VTDLAAPADTLTRASAAIAAELAGIRRLGVAFSGGVDSSVLLALAARALGPDQVVALLGVSPSLAAAERRGAHAVARRIGVEIVEIATAEGDRAAYRANGPDRCYHCKDVLFATIDAEVARSLGLEAIAYGENADDVRRIDRPGARAATEHGVRRPLATAGLTKADVRALARELGLDVADKPASPCLASRIPHFEEVTPEKLAQIDRAEESLRDLGLGELRVRHHGDIARLEVAADELGRIASEPLRSAILGAVRAAGFRYVTLDLAGLQSGAFTLPLVAVHHG